MLLQEWAVPLTHHEAEDDHIVVAEAQVLWLVLLATPTGGEQAEAGVVCILKEGSWYGKQDEECNIDGLHAAGLLARAGPPSLNQASGAVAACKQIWEEAGGGKEERGGGVWMRSKTERCK